MRVGVLGGVVAVALTCQSCVIGTVALDPKSRRVDVLDRTTDVEVWALPGVATVRDANGIVHQTPGRVPVRYRVKRKGYKRPTWMLITALVGSTTVTALAAATRESAQDGTFFDISTFDQDPLKSSLALLFFGDAFAGAFLIPQWIQHNERWKRRSRYEPIAMDNELVVGWEGWPETRVTVSAPDEKVVTVRRPTLGSFEEALIAWEREGSRQLTPEGMLELARAYASMALAPHDAFGIKGMHYYHRYLASSELGSEARETAEAELRDLETRGAQP